MARKAFTHQEKQKVNYSAELLYQVVKSVEFYPEFLPWCLAVEKTETGNNFFKAGMTVGFKTITSNFQSHVEFDDAALTINTKSIGATPLQAMHSSWRFQPIDASHCYVEFSVAVTFSSFITEKLFAPFFYEAIKKMSQAFFARAETYVKRGIKP